MIRFHSHICLSEKKRCHDQVYASAAAKKTDQKQPEFKLLYRQAIDRCIHFHCKTPLPMHEGIGYPHGQFLLPARKLY